MPDYLIEAAFKNKIIVGIDEVGRGPLAGPLMVVATYLNPQNYHTLPKDLNDSKTLSPKKRLSIARSLIAATLSLKYGIGIASASEVDELKLTKATEIAIIRALSQLNFTPDLAIIDGNIKYNLPIANIPIIKGDQKSLSIAASSVIAKVNRDFLMSQLALKYPEYLWQYNAGYGTKDHLEAIKQYGITKHHRKSFAPIRHEGLEKYIYG